MTRTQRMTHPVCSPLTAVVRGGAQLFVLRLGGAWGETITIMERMYRSLRSVLTRYNAIRVPV